MTQPGLFEQPGIAAVVLAAGLSRRMGQPKMVLPWGNQTVIGNVVSTLRAAGVHSITVVTGASARLVEKALETTPVTIVFNPHYANGDMLYSIQAGLASLLPDVQTALVVLGDQPQLEGETVSGMVNLYLQEKAPLIVPSYRMRRGHPWLIGRGLWDEILHLAPPETMRDFFRKHADRIRYVEVNSPSVLSDLDTPEDYEKSKPGS